MQASVIVAVLTWNGRKHLGEFLPSVIANSANAEVVVIDNASTDDTLTFLAEHYPDLRVVQNTTNSGYAGGYNEGLRQLEAEYFVLLNSDVEVTPGWISPLIAAMENDRSVAAAQPIVRSFLKATHFEYAGAAGGFMDKDYYPFCRGRMFDHAEEDKGQYNTCTEIFWATGACLFVRSSSFWEAGGFDPEFFAHMEEIDLCFRMKNEGKKIICVPESTVYHLGGGTLNYNSPAKTYLNFRNNLFLIHKNHFTSSLFAKVLKRLFLDGIAGAKFLVAGRFRHVASIIKAHFQYYRSIPRLNKQRAANRLKRKNPNLKGMYHSSILVDYFLKKKKVFSALDPGRFS